MEEERTEIIDLLKQIGVYSIEGESIDDMPIERLRTIRDYVKKIYF